MTWVVVVVEVVLRFCFISWPGMFAIIPAKLTFSVGALSLLGEVLVFLATSFGTFFKYESKSKSPYNCVFWAAPVLLALCITSTEEPKFSNPKLLAVVIFCTFPKVTPVSDCKAALAEPKSNPSKLKFVVVVVVVVVFVVVWPPTGKVVFSSSSKILASIFGVYIDCTPFTLVVVLYSPNWAPSFSVALEACKTSTLVIE